MVIRLSEIYLIRAEARAQQQNLAPALSDLDTIRSRAGLPPCTANGIQETLNAIYAERRVELFSEYGHRWLDLKRVKAIDQVMTVVSPHKGGSWNDNDSLYPIPFQDIQADPKLSQNPGYN